MCQISWAAILVVLWCGSLWAQSIAPAAPTPDSEAAKSIPLTVPSGMPLQVALDREVRIRRVGQPVEAKVVQPVYSFDKLVVPVGSEVTGKVARIERLSKKMRTLGLMNADFSPPRKIEVEFDELVLPDGRHMRLHTIVSPSPSGVMQFVASPPTGQAKKSRARNFVTRKISDAREQMQQDWHAATELVKQPGKIHRAKRIGMAQLPYRPQYLDAGTHYDAELQQPLDFGNETVVPDAFSSVGARPPAGSVVHALLLTPLSSATATQGEAIDALVTAPVFAADKLILPEGSHLRGSVLQVRPARRLKKNGQLRIVFHQISPPGGIEEAIEGTIEGVDVGTNEHLTLDSEGGAEVTTPKTRYLTTAISVALAVSSVTPDSDAETGVYSTGESGGRAIDGAFGFRALGIATAALVHSRVFSSGLGIYGAGMMVYSHFLTRGRDVVYPKDTAMSIGLGAREAKTPQAAQTRSGSGKGRR